jgi:hypothetical protein
MKLLVMQLSPPSRHSIPLWYYNTVLKYGKICLWQTASLVLWSQFPATHLEVPGSVPPLPDFLRSSGSVMESIQPREDNWGAT